MEILCLGLSYRTAPVELRERFAIGDGQLGEVTLRLARVAELGEAVIVSTCNRVELYVAAPEAGAGAEALEGFFVGLGAAGGGAPQERVGEHLYRMTGAPALRHLFRVASGLESMVLGETEILGQVKKAYQGAQLAGATGRHLNKLFQRAFNVAKEVRTNTNITRGSVSVGSVAVELAEKIFGRLTDCRVMILGAGETSELTAGALKARGVGSIFVANRSYERAAQLAEAMGGRAIHFDAWTEEIRSVDILIGSTAAPHHVLTADKLAPVMRTRVDRPLFCIDLAVPRDIDPRVNDLEGVYLYDIDSLQAIAERSMSVRRQDLALCEQMIERHVQEFGAWLEEKPRGVRGAFPAGGGAPEAAQS
jgi:glutamyl-tRNA reductase